MFRKKITKNLRESMLDLYRQGHGTVRIAKKLGLSKTAVRNNLLKKNVKFRKAPKDQINTNLHKKFIELYKRELSMKQIAQKTNSSFSTVRRHLKKEYINLKKRGNPKKITNPNYHKLIPEKAYILGVIGSGDGFIEHRRDNGQYRIVLEATNEEFIRYFFLCLKKQYGIEPTIKRMPARNFGINPTFIVRLGSKEVCDDLLSYKVSFKEESWRVLLIIKNASKEVQIKYLQGFADSQGCVSTRQIILASQNKEGLKDIIDLFHKIGIENIKYCKVGLILCDRKSLELFSKLINFNIPYKREKLEKEINRYKMWKTLRKNMDNIKPKIVTLRKKGLSYPKIAKELNISTSAAWNHSKNIEVPSITNKTGREI